MEMRSEKDGMIHCEYADFECELKRHKRKESGKIDMGWEALLQFMARMRKREKCISRYYPTTGTWNN